MGPGDEVGAVEVAFVAEVVGLRAAAGEGSLDDDGGSVGDRAHRVGVVADEEVELVEQVGRDDAGPGDVDLVLVVGGIGGGFRESGSAGAVVLGMAVFVGK